MISLERLATLSEDRRYVDVEEAHEAVRLVLHAGRPPVRCPRQALRDARRRVLCLTCQHARKHVHDLLKERRKAYLVPYDLPVARHEDNRRRCDEGL